MNSLAKILHYQISKVLFAHKASKRYFTSEGKLIKLSSDGVAILPKEAKIAVCKLNHFVFQQVLLAKNRQILHTDATIEKYGLGEQIGLDMEELLLASLDTVETY